MGADGDENDGKINVGVGRGRWGGPVLWLWRQRNWDHAFALDRFCAIGQRQRRLVHCALLGLAEGYPAETPERYGPVR